MKALAPASLAILLAVLLTAPAIPVSAADSRTLEIGTPADLAALADQVNDGYDLAGWTVVLTADLDMTGVSMLPIGLARYTFDTDDVIAGDPVFRGVFDGAGHTIANLTIDLGTDYADYGGGLFGTTVGASLRHLTLQDCTVNGRSDLGLLAGTAKSTALIDVHAVGGSVNSAGATSFCVGGLVGWYYSLLDKVTVTACSSSAAVNVRSETLSRYTGGLFGAFECRSASGSLSLSAGWATGPVTVADDADAEGVGGLVGIGIANDGDTVTLADCYATGALQVTASSADRIGGLVGSFRIGILANMEIVSAYYAGTISGGNAGGVYGGYELDSGDPLLLTACRYDRTLFAGGAAGDGTEFVDAFGLSTAAMQSVSLADTLNAYDGAWSQTAGSYPVLKSAAAPADYTGVLLWSLAAGGVIILCWALVLERLLKKR